MLSAGLRVRPVPNMAHPLNHQRVIWFYTDNSRALINLIPARVRVVGSVTRHTPAPSYRLEPQNFTVGGPIVPGGFGSAWKRNSVGAGSGAGGSEPQELYHDAHQLTISDHGFSVAFWICSLASSDSGPVCGYGIGEFLTQSAGGWGIYATPSALELEIGRATTRQQWTATVSLPVRVWRRVMVTWHQPLNTQAYFYVDGVLQLPSLSQAGSGAINPESASTPVDLRLGRGDHGTLFSAAWYSGFSIWRRQLSGDEAIMDYREASRGYPCTLLRPVIYYAGEPDVVASEGFQEGIGLGSAGGMTLGPEFVKGFALGSASAFILPDEFKSVDKGFALGAGFNYDGEVYTLTKGIGLGGDFGYVEELRHGIALGSTTSLTLEDPVGNTTEGFALGSRLRSQSDALDAGRYRR